MTKRKYIITFAVTLASLCCGHAQMNPLADSLLPHLGTTNLRRPLAAFWLAENEKLDKWGKCLLQRAERVSKQHPIVGLATRGN